MATLKIKNFSLKTDDYVISTNNLFFDYTTRTTIGLDWTVNATNWSDRAAGNGDQPLGNDAIKVDGNLIFTCGYGDGISVRRINDDGTITQVYGETQPANSYAYYPSIAVDKVRKQFYVGNWVYDNLTRYTYTDTASIGSTKETLTTAGNDLPEDEVSYTWMNGLEVVGDYLYIAADGAATTTAQRWLIPSESAESLTVTNLTSNAQFGHVWYDEGNNRVYYNWRVNGMIWVVTNPEATASYAGIPAGTVTASAFQVRTDTIVGGNDQYYHTLVPDNDNPNHMWVSSNYGRFALVDITPCLEGTSATPTLIRKGTRSNVDNRQRPLFLYNEGMSVLPHPVYGSDMPIQKNYGGAGGYMYSWFDIENYIVVCPSLQNVYGFAKRGITSSEVVMPTNQLNIDRATIPRPYSKVRASGGTEYWVISGYSGDYGGAIISYPASEFPNFLELHTIGSIVFGTFEFEDSRYITSIQISDIARSVFEHSDTSFRAYVSNNGGSSWESYGWRDERVHIFSSRGRQAQLKIVLRGSGKRGAYVYSLKAINVSIRGTDRSERQVGRNLTSSKIQGI